MYIEISLVNQPLFSYIFGPVRINKKKGAGSQDYIEIGSASLQIRPYKVLPFTNFLKRQWFFSSASFFLSFSSHTFSWACGSFIFIAHFFVGLRKFFQTLFCTFTCLSNNSLISAWISAKFVSALLPCSYML